MSAAEHSAEHAPTGSEYIVHHLGNLKHGEGFWTFNLDSIFFSVLLGVLFTGSFWLAARKATATGVPRGFQSFVETVVDFVDSQVRDTFHGTSKIIAPLALTIFCWILLMNFMDAVPVDLFPQIGEKAFGLEHLKVVPTTDLNITLGMSITVFLIVMFYSFKVKGFGGFTWELLTHPFGKWMMPFNLLLNLIEHLARPDLARSASVRKPVRRRNDLPAARRARRQLRHHLRRGHRRSHWPARAGRDLGLLPHPGDSAAGFHIHGADDRVPRTGARDSSLIVW